MLALLPNFSAAESIPAKNNADADPSTCQSADGKDGECASSNSLSSVYVISDLHGDAICAVSWANRTGLIANLFVDESGSSSTDSTPLYMKLNNPSKWEWTNSKATLVFMGDYVDKGPQSKQTVEFVKDLTTAFPDKVTAILGNHELELLRDRDARIPPEGRYSAYSYATVHPGDYHSYIDSGEQKDPSQQSKIRALDEKDDLVLDLLLEAAMEVYSFNAHSAVRFVPSLPNQEASKQRGIHYAITDIIPPEHRMLAMERLQEYQDAYLNAFRSGTSLGGWMEKRPILHLAEDINTLFVHGGVSEGVGTSYLSKGKEGVDELNSAWWEHSHEGKLYDFLTGKGMSANDILGYVVYELLTFRGNHREHILTFF